MLIPLSYQNNIRFNNNALCNVDRLIKSNVIQMEHSYSRDCRPIEGANGLTTRCLMIHKPPLCPSCHVHPIDEGVDLDEANHPPIPSYNEIVAKESMNECSRVANSVRNLNSDEQDWEENINKIGWTSTQEKLFSQVCRVLDLDHLARLSTIGRQHEPVQRRVIIDRSVQRMRQALAAVSWDSRLTQWIHGLLMDQLPPIYMASYLDILQTLKTKLPTLMDKMLFGKPMNINQDLLTPVMKKQWDPIVNQKTRKLPMNAVIVIIPTTPISGAVPSRMQKWYMLLQTIAPIVQISVPANTMNKQSIDQLAEHLVSITRVKIQELRAEQPARQIILVGFNAGGALALQVALQETVNSVVCLGFAFNTINGIRGAPDDHLLDLTIPIMFVIGQNAARTSQEEMEALREKMQSETSLVVVGSADDVLRVPKTKRQIEGVTQSMIDNMITDELYDFMKNCLVNPPGPRTPSVNAGSIISHSSSPQVRKVAGGSSPLAGNIIARKRKKSQDDSDVYTPSKTKFTPGNRSGNIKFPNLISQCPLIKRKVGRPRLKPVTTSTPAGKQLLAQPTTEALNMAIQSILPDTDKVIAKSDDTDDSTILSTYEIITQPAKVGAQGGSSNSPVILPVLQRTNNSNTSPKIKMIPATQFVHLKSASQSGAQKIYTIKTTPGIASTNQSQSQVYTVKQAGTSQFISSTSPQQIVINPQKFTVIKPTTTNVITTGGVDTPPKTTSDLASANIFDMPILFADNDGNIHDTAPITTTPVSSASQSQQIIIGTSSGDQSTVNRNFLVSNAIQKAKPNKVVFINRNTMKPCPSIISKGVPPLKYTKLVVTNPKTSTQTLVSRPANIIDSDKQIITLQKPKTLEFPPGTIVKTTGAFTGSSAMLSTSSTANKQYQPIIINVDSDKTTIKNMIKVSDNQIKPTILLKPGSIKQVIKPSIINRNVTVRKVVNLGSAKTGITSVSSAGSVNDSSSAVMATTSGTHFITPQSTSKDSD